MPKQTAYKSLEVYNLSKQLVIACYELTHGLPQEEKTNFTRYIRTAALSVHINIAQGAFLKEKKREKYIREARKGLVVIDTAAEILVEVRFATREEVEVVTRLSSDCSRLLDQL